MKKNKDSKTKSFWCSSSQDILCGGKVSPDWGIYFECECDCHEIAMKQESAIDKAMIPTTENAT